MEFFLFLLIKVIYFLKFSFLLKFKTTIFIRIVFENIIEKVT